MKIEEIEKILEKKNIDYGYSDSDKLIIKACVLDENNFFDYGEKPSPLKIEDKELHFLKNEKNVVIIRCDECSCCAGW